jgi:hypothetical protein
MFSDDQGSWMTMFLVSLISLFIFSWVYNAFLWAGGSSTEDYRIIKTEITKIFLSSNVN